MTHAGQTTAQPVLSEFDTTDAEAMREYLVATYGTGLRIQGDGDGLLRMRHRRLDAGAFCLDTAAQLARLAFSVEPMSGYVVCMSTTSRVDRTCGRSEGRYAPGAVFLMNRLDLPHATRWLPGRVEATVLDPSLLAQVAETAPARRAAAIGLTGLDPVSPAAAAHWNATRAYVAGLLANPAAVAQPLMLGAAGRLLAGAALAVFPNTALGLPTIEDRHDAHPATLRRALTYIDDHPGHDLSPADIAAAAGVTIRAMQLAFRRHLDTTPMAYVRRVRLACAHRDLQAADPTKGDTVIAIANRWGFAHPGRFTAFYRSVYDVPPSVTLRA
ncbi:AraC-type DNA-binding protein [Nonomuraea solani]|uniref:AraC-type DNA-binding protein n=1 Tax=Nonomuraea solani TaxID=1144553 RepID=A0A1H6EPT3_9ACTN|nr:helix-turn-helix transcriptional regulator [Nonomuraea solani]SEG99878.1 AraC-type DNA-binding protein [Nonomuraea solani]